MADAAATGRPPRVASLGSRRLLLLATGAGAAVALLFTAFDLAQSAAAGDAWSLGGTAAALLRNAAGMGLFGAALFALFRRLVLDPLGRIAATAEQLAGRETATGDPLATLDRALQVLGRRLADALASDTASQRQYREIFEHSPIGLFRAGTDGFLLEANPAMARLLGHPSPEAVVRSVGTIGPALFTDPDAYAAWRADLARDGAVEQREVCWRRADGSSVWVALGARTARGSDGQVHIEGCAQDIDALVAAQAAARAGERRLEGLFAFSPDPFSLIEVDTGIYRHVSRSWVEQTGFPRDEVIGRSSCEFQLWQDQADRVSAYEELSRTGVLRTRALTLMRRDGEPRTFAISAAVVDGDPRLAIWMNRDITDQLAMERELRQASAAREASLAQLRAITDNLPVWITYTDVERRLRFVNATAARWLARPVDDLLGRRMPEILPPRDTAPVQPIIAEVLAGGPRRIERMIPYPDGVARTIDVIYVPDLREDGAVHGYYTLALDITDRRRAEEQLRRSQRLEAVGQLTGGVAHDFNNLLAVVSGNLELLGEALAERPDLRGMVSTALRAVDRGAILTQALLAFARRQPLQPQIVDLGKVIGETTELLRRTLPESIDLVLHSAPSLWSCKVDPGQIQNALMNLVLNARDAMPAGGQLAVTTANTSVGAGTGEAGEELPAGDYVELAVGDTGTGMAPDVLARAFEPFFTTKDVGHGSGLGLSMVYGFARQSGGDVRIESAVGAGTTVRIRLPRAQAAPAAAVPHAASRGETILLVEDNPEVRDLTEELLRSLGYDVLVAADGEAALRCLQASPSVALLLSDVVLPGGMSGPRLAELAVASRPGIGVLFMSGYTEGYVVGAGQPDVGARLLQKPFRKAQLAAAVRAALEDGERTG